MAVLRQQADGLGAAGCRQRGEWRFFQQDLSRAGQQTGQRVEQCGLAGAVGADQAEQLTGRQRQIDVVQARRHVQGTGSNQRHRVRSRQTSQMNSGAPTSAVSTPSLTSRSGGNRRTTMSATTTSVAPPSAEGSSS